jgi:hypothetical protein
MLFVITLLYHLRNTVLPQDFNDEVIFEQLDTQDMKSKGGRTRWGVYIILEGAVTVSRGREVPESPDVSPPNEEAEPTSAASALFPIAKLPLLSESPEGEVEADGEGDVGDDASAAGNVAVAAEAAVAIELTAVAGVTSGSDSPPLTSKRSVRFDEAVDESEAVNHSYGGGEDDVVQRRTAHSRASLAVKRPKSRMLTPHYKHQLHRTLKNKACKTHLTVEDSHTIELFKGSGHVIGMLSILTGHPRYVKLAATGPVTAAFVDAEHFLAIFVDDEEQIALAARETGVMDSTAVGAGSGGMGDVDVAYANPMARRGGAMSDAHANTTGRVSITERVVPTLTGATANAGGSAQPREVRLAPTIDLDEVGAIYETRGIMDRKQMFSGVTVDAWYDYRAGVHAVRTREGAGEQANGTKWQLHDVSPLEREFCLEAAVTAAQIFMRLSADGASGDTVVGGEGSHPQQSQALLLGVGAVLANYPAFESGLPAYFKARHFDPEAIDLARPILEKATVMMPSLAVLPCIITLTHPCILLDGRVWIVSKMPGFDTEVDAADAGADGDAGDADNEMSIGATRFDNARDSFAAGVHSAPLAQHAHGDLPGVAASAPSRPRAETSGSVFDLETGGRLSSFGAIASPALIVASADYPVRIKIDVAKRDVAAEALESPTPHDGASAKLSLLQKAESSLRMKGKRGSRSLLMSRKRNATKELKPPTAPRLVVLPDEVIIATTIMGIVSGGKKKFNPRGSMASKRGGGGSSKGGGGHHSSARSSVNPATGSTTMAAPPRRRRKAVKSVKGRDLRHHPQYHECVDRLVARQLAEEQGSGVEHARIGLRSMAGVGH